MNVKSVKGKSPVTKSTRLRKLNMLPGGFQNTITEFMLFSSETKPSFKLNPVIENTDVS